MVEHIKIYKKKLKNGLIILVVPLQHMPKVVMQLFYRVGSCDEQTNQKGLAHLIEHMIFKGTSTLSEPDINTITTKLSGSCNAFTSHDYTGYIFEFPTQHWVTGFELLADCMRNCTFKPALLNSELKAVIQELKMYRDNYELSVIDELMSAIFRGHPYHYPIIGFKYDLCLVNQQQLKDFYSRYYTPGNATLVVVGNVDPEDVFKQAMNYFGTYAPVALQERAPVYWERDLSAKSLTLYRDVQTPVVIAAFVVPGVRSKKGYAIDILNWIIGSGRGSRLYKKLVEQLGISIGVDSFYYDLFDYGLLCIQVQPKALQNISEIIQQIKQEISELREHGVQEAELARAQAKEQMAYVSFFEDHQRLAHALGKLYVATHDEHYLFNYCNVSGEQVLKDLGSIIDEWVHPSVMHVGYVLPLEEKDKAYWQLFQQQSDICDQKMLADKKRESAVEAPVYALKVPVHPFGGFIFPHYTMLTLSNGLEVLYYADHRIPKVECLLEFKANYLYDPDDKQGLSNFASHMLLKGTSAYTAIELVDIFESKGIGIAVTSGGLGMNCLSHDLSFALKLVNHVLTDSIYAPESVEKVRHKINVDLTEHWDQPYQFVNDIVRKHIYKGHAYSKSLLGSLESVQAITHDDLLSYYKNYITPQGARLAIVGNFDESILKQLLENTLGKWMGPHVADLKFPELTRPAAQIITYPINRDQVVLAFAGLSVARKDPVYDQLLLFDQEFGGGVLGTMSSMLFKIREQSGLFYTIVGTVLAGVDKQPGIVLIKTIISLDRLTEAEKTIKHVISIAPDEINDQMLEQSKRALINTMMDHFESYHQIGATFLGLRRFELPVDYFDTRAQQLQKIDLLSVRAAAKKILNLDTLITVMVGRV